VGGNNKLEQDLKKQSERQKGKNPVKKDERVQQEIERQSLGQKKKLIGGLAGRPVGPGVKGSALKEDR